MANNIIGYVGTENYEVILYLSRILDRLGKKVLMVDYSELEDLTICIPVPSGLYPEDDIITYFGVDFTKRDLDSQLVNEYDDILINFGFRINNNVSQCTQIVYVTDQQKFNIEKLAALPSIEIETSSLIIKDMVESKINEIYITDRLQKNIDLKNTYVFALDGVDMTYKILVQFNTLYEFKRISKAVKRYLLGTIKTLYPDINQKELKRAYKLAERGR